MKITGQNVPPELQTLYFSVISTNNTGTGAGKRARTRRARKVRPTKKRKVTFYNDLLPVCIALISATGDYLNERDLMKKAKAEVAAINQGIWNPKYWIKAELLATVYLQSTPTSTPDPAPPPYAYRDPAKWPTLTNWTDGTPASGPARYSGQLQGGQFNDLLLVWTRYTFKLRTKLDNSRAGAAVLTWEPTITATASARGSRPMFSAIMRAYLCSATGATLSTVENPAAAFPPSAPPDARGASSFFWRYKVPKTPPPFYYAAKYRRILRHLAPIATIETAPELSRAVICAAPRPMFGRGFNNNDTVNTSLSGNMEIHQFITEPATAGGPVDIYTFENEARTIVSTYQDFYVQSVATSTHSHSGEFERLKHSTSKVEVCLFGQLIKTADYSADVDSYVYPTFVDLNGIMGPVGAWQLLGAGLTRRFACWICKFDHIVQAPSSNVPCKIYYYQRFKDGHETITQEQNYNLQISPGLWQAPYMTVPKVTQAT